MKRDFIVVYLLMGMSALAGAGYGQGQGQGQSRGGDAGHSSGSTGSTGSSGFRPSSGPAPVVVHPQVVQRPQVIVQNPVVVVPKPVVVQPHSVPFNPGNAGTLPSVGNPYRPRSTTQFQPPINNQPVQRSAPHGDFLGFQGQPGGAHQSVPHQIIPGINGPARTFQPTVNHGIIPNLPVPQNRAVIANIPRKAEHQLTPDQRQFAAVNYADRFNQWSQANAGNIAAFQANRMVRWNQVQQHPQGAAWFKQANTPQYHQWHQAAWDYRKERAREIWARTRGLHDNLFNAQWWAGRQWRTRPWAINSYASPWWWWNTSSWGQESAFFGSDLGAGPIAYDPGTNVFYDDNTYDVNGQDVDSANDAREQAMSLADAPVDETPVPEPAQEGQPEQWLPLGSWALTQQQQGDPVIYFQISVDRSGIVAGGYKNALTGEEQPIVGRLDKRQQRLAWHIPSNPQTVFETGLSSLDYDVANVFVHFGSSQTQTWLLVRLPSPEDPPDAVNAPDQPE